MAVSIIVSFLIWLIRVWGVDIAVSIAAYAGYKILEEQIDGVAKGLGDETANAVRRAVSDQKTNGRKQLNREQIAAAVDLRRQHDQPPTPRDDAWENPEDEIEDLLRRECADWEEFENEQCG